MLLKKGVRKMPREYSLLDEDILKYNPRLIMTGGGGVDLRAKGADLLGKKGDALDKAMEQRELASSVEETMQDLQFQDDFMSDYQGVPEASMPSFGMFDFQTGDFSGGQPAETGGSPFMESSFGLGGFDPYGLPDFGGEYFGQSMAEGGPVQEGQSYVVGEEGPEMFVPNQSGTIVPNDKSFSQGIQEFWNELFGGQGVAQEDFIKQPPLMPRDSSIGFNPTTGQGITPVPQVPNPIQGQQMSGLFG
jgi:hypothetical protein